MCYGSQLVFKTEPAQVGQEYRIMNAGDFGMESGVLVRPNEGPRGKDAKISCAACVTEEMPVLITGVPFYIESEYDLDETVLARFVPAAEGEHTDWIQVDDRRIPLAKFADEHIRMTLLTAESARSFEAIAA